MLKYGTGVYFSLNWILVRINRCLHHTWARQNTYYRRHIKYFAFSFEMLQTPKQNSVESRKKQNDKNWFYQRTSEHFIDTSIKIRSNFFYRSHDTIIIRLSMEIKCNPILKRFFTSKDFCRKYVTRNIGWKIVSCDRTFTVPQLLFQKPAILKNNWTSSSKNRAYNFYSYCQKKL